MLSELIQRRCVLWLGPPRSALETSLLLPRVAAEWSGNGIWTSSSHCVQVIEGQLGGTIGDDFHFKNNKSWESRWTR